MRNIFLLLLIMFILNIPLITRAEEIRTGVSVSSTVVSNSEGRSMTDVRIETNGEVKTFHIEGNQSVNWQSDDSQAKVQINNQNSSNQTSIIQKQNGSDANINMKSNGGEETIKKPTIIPSPDFEKLKNLDLEIKKETDNIFTYVQNQLNQINKMISDSFKKIFG